MIYKITVQWECSYRLPDITDIIGNNTKGLFVKRTLGEAGIVESLDSFAIQDSPHKPSALSLFLPMVS